MHAVQARRVCRTAPMHCTGKQDIPVIYIYSTSDQSKQKLLVDVEISFFLTPEMSSDIFRPSYVNYNNRCIRTHESDFEVTVCRLGKIIQRIFFAQSEASICRATWKWSGETFFPGALLLLKKTFSAMISARFTSFCPD